VPPCLNGSAAYDRDKVVTMISQGSVVTQAMLSALNIHAPVTNFIQFTCAKNYENWLKVDKVIAMKIVWFFWPTQHYLTYPYTTLCLKKCVNFETV